MFSQTGDGSGMRLGLLCGVDIIEIDRIEKSLCETGNAFRDKVFTPGEIQYCEERKAARYQSYAVRFAAKEAVAKALGTGISMGIGWKDIEVYNEPGGKPHVRLTGRAQEYYLSLGAEQIAISLSHSRDYAVAYATILTR